MHSVISLDIQHYKYLQLKCVAVQMYYSLRRRRNKMDLVKKLVSTSMLLLAAMAGLVLTCPTPSCDRTSSCELYDHISNNSLAVANIVTTVTLGEIINPAVRTSTHHAGGFTSFRKEIDYVLRQESVGNATAQDCLLDSPPEEQCSHKIVAFSVPGLKCGFEYHCDYNRNRIPQYIWRAECLPTVSGVEAIPVYYKVPVLEMRDNIQDCNPFGEGANFGGWMWTQLEVPVACTCRDSFLQS